MQKVIVFAIAIPFVLGIVFGLWSLFAWVLCLCVNFAFPAPAVASVFGGPLAFWPAFALIAILNILLGGLSRCRS